MFEQSRKLVWFTLGSCILLQAYAFYAMGNDAAIIATTTLPAMLALVGGWTHVTNRAQVEHRKMENGG